LQVIIHTGMSSGIDRPHDVESPNLQLQPLISLATTDSFLSSSNTVKKTFLIDLVITAIFVVIYGSLSATHSIPVFHRNFFLDDESIMLPYRSDSVPMWLVYVLSVGFPIILLGCMWKLQDLPVAWALNLFSALIRTHLLTGFFTLFMKSLAGRQRPNFLSQCVPNVALCVNNQCTYDACTGETHAISEAYKSFPSGHTSVMFAGMMFLSLLTWQLTKPRVTGNVLAMLCAGLPILAGVYVGISRTQDYKHHREDVLVGGITGIVIAKFFFDVALHRPTFSPHTTSGI